MFIEKLLQLMAEKKASDIFISVGSPIMIKIQGNIMPVNPQVMDAEQTKKIVYEMLTPAQIATFEKDLELNLSKPMPGLGNFRVNVFWQKGSVACVIRYITADIPKLEDLNLPHGAPAARDGEARPGPRGGRHGLGQVDHARLDARLPQPMVANHILTIEDPVEYVFTPKKCIFNQREVGNDTHAFHDALRNAMRQAPDCILIGEIRDQETMRMALTYALSGPPVPRHAARQQLLPGDEPRDQLLPAGSAPDAAAGPLGVPQGDRLAAPGEDGGRQAHPGRRGAPQHAQRRRRPIEKGEVGEVKEMMEKSMSPGSQTFEQDLFRLVRQGKISTDEALANADSATNLGLLLGNSGIMPAMAERAKNPVPTLGKTPGRPVLQRVQDLGGALRAALRLHGRTRPA